MKKILVILGPTATGKTDLALNLADKLNGELVACDSRQVYRGLDIGAGKMPGEDAEVLRGDGFWEINGVKVWVYDVCDPRERYDVSKYIKDATKDINEVTDRGKLPIIVGGTGLYLKGLLEGFSNFNKKTNEKLRGELEKLSKEGLQEKLSLLSPTIFSNLNNSEKNNPRRLIRHIEILLNKNDKNYLECLACKFHMLRIGLMSSREVLNARIDRRVLKRINQGMIQEVDGLLKSGLSYERLQELGLEYRIISDYLTGKISSKEELINQLQKKIHQYAKRQMTWFKRENAVFWFDISDKGYERKVERKVLDWYNGT